MLRKITALLTACLYLLVSCTSTKLVNPTEVRGGKDHIIALALTSGEIIEFDLHGGRLDKLRERVTGDSKDGKKIDVAFADVVSATVQHTSGGTAVLVVVALFFFIVLVAATADSGSSSSTSGSSCPYVYAFDGDQYTMDAEPLSGAITKGFERNDLCRLDHLRAVDGHYDLLVRNELKETQYIDQMQLRVVDHPSGASVCTDINGSLHVLADRVAPAAAHDEAGVDLRALLRASDHIPWQSTMPVDESWRDMSLRNELTFEFAKPRDASQANLVIDAATSQWGSIMMRQMMEARGNRLADWYASVDERGLAMAELLRFNQREELYFLKLYVQEGNEWVQQGWIPGGGPAASELRVIPIDLSRVSGDTVRIRVAPPRGFWSFDYIAMSYHELPAPDATVLPVASAMTSDHRDMAALITATDEHYYEMKNVGESAHITFAAPVGPARGSERSVFLETRGYYHTQIDETLPEQTALIADVLAHEGAVVRYSLQRYAEMVARSRTMP
jgi:hypothetical protein